MPSRRFIADSALLFVAFIWGVTFVMVQEAVYSYPVFAFLFTRFLLALIGLLPILWWRRSHLLPTPHQAPLRQQMAAGALIGLLLFAGYAFQTAGLQYTTPAKAGFITGLGVVFVPVLGLLFRRERPSPVVGLGIAAAALGLAFLSLSGVTLSQGVNRGDLLVLGCSISFAAQIFAVGHFAPRMNALALTTIQLATVVVLAGAASLLFEPGTPWPPTGQPLFAAFFTGILCTALAFGIQTAAQRSTTATHTALIFATEPVFAALASFVLIGEQLGPAQLFGCSLILAGMLLAEVGPGLGAAVRREAGDGRREA